MHFDSRVENTHGARNVHTSLGMQECRADLTWQPLGPLLKVKLFAGYIGYM